MSDYIELTKMQGAIYGGKVSFPKGGIIAFSPAEGDHVKIICHDVRLDGIYAESYEQVKAMLAGDTNDGDTNKHVPIKITAKELNDAVCNERIRCKCNSISRNKCKWRDKYVNCDYLIIADYINRKLKGEAN